MKNLVIIVIIFSLLSCGQNPHSNQKAISSGDSTELIDTSHSNNMHPTLTESLNNKVPNTSNKEITKSWSLQDGWFPNQNLNFIHAEKETDAMVFNFRKNGTIEYLNKDFGDCPVGAFTMKDGKWTKEGQNLTLELRGLKIADYWYWWKVQYKIKELTSDNLKLEVVKVIKNKAIKPTLEWADLIKE